MCRERGIKDSFVRHTQNNAHQSGTGQKSAFVARAAAAPLKTALLTALLAFSGSGAVCAEPIILNNDNIDNFTDLDGNMRWLKGAPEAASANSAETPPLNPLSRNYLIDEMTVIDNLGLRQADTGLTVDMRRKPSLTPLLAVNDILRLEDGYLHIIAAKTPAEDAPPLILPQAVVFQPPMADAIPGFIQTGGSALIEAQDNAAALRGEISSFYRLEGGGLTVRSRDKATGIDILYDDMSMEAMGFAPRSGADALFLQKGGSAVFEADDESIGLKSSRSAEIEAGNLAVSATHKAKGIMLYANDAEFRQKGGTIFLKAAGEATGLETAKFQMEGGRLYLTSGGSGKALHLISAERAAEDGAQTEIGGQFLFHKGEIQIARMADSPGGYAVYGEAGSRAVFGGDSVLQPLLDASEYKNAPITGLMSFGAVQIDNGAALNIQFKNTDKITGTEPLNLHFLESREQPIAGDFRTADAGGERLFYNYEAMRSEDGKSYQIRLTPKDKSGESGGDKDKDNDGGKNPDGDEKNPDKDGADNKGGENSGKPPDAALRISDIAGGNNKRAALAMEAALKTAPNGQNEIYPPLRQLYDELYNSELGGERQIRRRLRALSPAQATRLPALSLGAQQHFAGAIRDSVTQFFIPEKVNAAAPQAAADSAPAAQNLWAIGFAPAGGHIKYSAQNSGFGSLSADYGGLNFSAATDLGDASVGLAGGFSAGRLRGGDNYHADMRHLFIGGGFAYNLRLSENFRPLLDMSFSYGNGRFKQRRRDSFGSANHAPIDQNSFMLSAAMTHYYDLGIARLQAAPQLGLDYAYIRQNAYKEKGGLLPLRVKGQDFNALQPKLGSSLLLNRGEQLAAKAYAYYRYDILDTNIALNAQLRGAEAMAWKTRGEDSSRSSGNFGTIMDYRLRPNILISGVYDVLLRENRTAQQFSAQTKIKF